jgi:hypothetical protein
MRLKLAALLTTSAVLLGCLSVGSSALATPPAAPPLTPITDPNPPVMGHRGVSPLEGAIESRNLAVFKAIFEAGGNPNTRGSLYMNAFHGAIWTGEHEVRSSAGFLLGL